MRHEEEDLCSPTQRDEEACGPTQRDEDNEHDPGEQSHMALLPFFLISYCNYQYLISHTHTVSVGPLYIQ